MVSPCQNRHAHSRASRRDFLRFASVAGVFSAAGRAPAIQTSRNRPKPNFVVIFMDDMGYADIGPFGAFGYSTPNLNAMARRGTRFTDFHAGTAICSASRAALMSGCYPVRVSVHGAYGPHSKVGLNPDETLIPEILKSEGYSTACYGKWHLGDAPPFLPTRNGFDEYFGLPYSNDMWPNHPTAGRSYPPLPLMEGERVIQLMPDQTQLTTWYTERAVDFIERKKDKPFFCYVPHSMVHVPLFVSEKFRGKTGSLFGDVVEEVDWSVGEISGALRRLRLEENTFVVFTSDNGPWLTYGDHVGSALPHREGKATMWNGGTAEPCIMEWPGRIPAGKTCRELASTIDLLPTIAAMAGSRAVQGGSVHGRKIDGVDLAPLLRDPENTPSPRQTFYHYWTNELHAVRKGNWKLHFPHESFTITEPGKAGKPGKSEPTSVPLSLYDLARDPGEHDDVLSSYPMVVQELSAVAEAARADLGDSLTGRTGPGVRPPGCVEA